MTIQRQRKRDVPPRPLIVTDVAVVCRPLRDHPARVVIEVAAFCSECGASKRLKRMVRQAMADRQIILFVRYLNGLGWRCRHPGRIVCPAHPVS